MMTVYYGGNMTGYHSIGRRGVKLVPGPNTVPYEVGMALVDAEIAVSMEDQKKPKTSWSEPSSEPSEAIEAAADDEAGGEEI